MEGVLPSKDVKKRIASLAVGLAADCDSPESGVQKIMRANLAGAQRLPFAGFITHDGKWIGGFSGYKDTSAFLRVLKAAEDHPYLQASKAVRKKLAGLVAKANQAADKGDWKSVMKAAQAAAKTSGRCPEREALAEVVETARDWATQQFAAAVRIARSGGDLTEARGAVNDVKKSFSGEPESADADTGLKALSRLSQIVRIEAGAAPLAEARHKASRKYKDTRWTSIFEPEEGD